MLLHTYPCCEHGPVIPAHVASQDAAGVDAGRHEKGHEDSQECQKENKLRNLGLMARDVGRSARHDDAGRYSWHRSFGEVAEGQN